MRYLVLLAIALGAIGCSSGDVSVEQIQQNAKAANEAAQKDPNTGGNAY